MLTPLFPCFEATGFKSGTGVVDFTPEQQQKASIACAEDLCEVEMSNCPSCPFEQIVCLNDVPVRQECGLERACGGNQESCPANVIDLNECFTEKCVDMDRKSFIKYFETLTKCPGYTRIECIDIKSCSM